MVKIFPDTNIIGSSRQAPSEGELKILQFLQNNLDDDFEIYYKPFINGDRPNIVLLRPNHGVVLIEVRDWELNDYEILENTEWQLKQEGSIVQSPFDQLKTYKENLYNLHIDTLLAKKLQNDSYFSLVKTLVYFSQENTSAVQQFIFDRYQDNKKYSASQKSLKYTTYWGADSLTKENLDRFLRNTRLDQVSALFDEVLYESFKRYLKPPLHLIEEGKNISYSKAQEELIRSEQRPRRKIKGLAGSGKTFVLAKRAVNAHLRTKSDVLILTYNISLKNYIHDRISDVREEFSWDYFHIMNYHQFIKTEANNYGLKLSLKSFEDSNFFKPVRGIIKKYQTILIDEVQDYNENWLKIIHDYFLVEDGEFVVFGDEKQNIYQRPLDENREPRTIGIPGVWNRSLNESKRSTTEITRLAMEFQRVFMAKKYSIDDQVAMASPTLEFQQKIIDYKNFGIETTTRDIFNAYVDIVKKYSIHPSDICFLSVEVECLRNIDHLIRHELKEKTTTTFETEEYHKKLNTEPNSRDKIKGIRTYKKNHFWMKTGTTKLSSIYSFKGWESHTVFLIIEPDRNGKKVEPELIYTALTRAQVNLFIFNLGNSFYDAFFAEKIRQ